MAFRASRLGAFAAARGLVAGLALALALAAIGSSAPAAPVRPGYVPLVGQTCGGYPKLPIEMAKAMCAGLVLGPPPEGLRPSKRQLHLPRNLLALPDGDMLVVDLGSWETGHGALWRLNVRSGGSPELVRLLDGLNLPHAIAIGPDGGVYLGEMDRIIRLDPAATDVAASIQVVVTGLPGNRLHEDRHPLSSFLFDANGDLLVNVGAASDQCADPPRTPEGRCEEIAGARPRAAIWRYAYLGEGRWAQDPSVFAIGLRNSVALARHRSGTLWQAENSIDVDDPAFPYDEINRLQAGGDYGWPYCVNIATPAPAWRGRGAVDCHGADYVEPALLLPPHAAPLAMLYYEGPMFPALQGRLIISFHGYRSTGGRIVAYVVDADGAPVPDSRPTFAAPRSGASSTRRLRFREAPAASGRDLTPGWDLVAGERPKGAPSGFAVAADGALWSADDRNGTIIRFARDAP